MKYLDSVKEIINESGGDEEVAETGEMKLGRRNR
jgi:hypothetical protein